MAETGVDDAFTYIFTWRTSRDDRVCQWCDPLDGEVMFFDLFSDILISDTAGPVWDLNLDRSLLHGASGTCRCTLEVEVEVDWSQIAEFAEFRENLGKVRIDFKLIVERFKLSSVISEARSQMNNFLDGLGNVKTELREVNQGFTTYLALADESGLPRSMIQGLRTIQQVRLAIEMLHRSFMMMQAASGPIGWLAGLGGFAISTMMLVDQMEIRRPRY